MPKSNQVKSSDFQTALTFLVGDATSIVDDAKADESLVTLIQIAEMANAALADCKKQIEAKALERTADFKGIKSDHVVISYRSSGTKYKPAKGVDPATLPPEYVKASTRYFLQSDAIETYHDKNGKFPKGVEVAERKKSIVFDLLSDGKEKV